MDDLTKVVPVTDFKIKVQHHTSSLSDEVLNGLQFSEINNYYKEGGGLVPIKQYFSLGTLKERLNSIKYKVDKSNSIAILKGIYKGGTAGGFCTQPAPFLFYDIDIKDNMHLENSFLNAELFEQLKKTSCLVWRSSSGKGIAGVLYVPQLSNVTDTRLHLSIGKEITKYLGKLLTIKACFDNAQSKFRQVRYLAKQEDKQTVNTTPLCFTYEVKEIKKKSKNGVTQYRFIDNRAVRGSIREQFNNSTSIHDALLQNGFSHVQGDRYKHPRTTSKTTGHVKDNIFFNHSTSFSSYRLFCPFWLFYTEYYQHDFKRFLKDLKSKGYTDAKPTQKAFTGAENILKKDYKDRELQIFEACYDLANASYKEKIKFINKNARNNKEKILFYDYLKIKNLKIKYDSTHTIQKYVSEKLTNVLDFADTHKKIILNADTGTGKTTSFIKEFEKLRPYKRILMLAPLTVIVNQINAEHNILAITGDATPEMFTKAKKQTFVVATFEQGYKLLSVNNTFDYLIIDEVHNLITANQYKSETIKNLTSVFKNKTIIGLTGTPNLLFKSLGFKLMLVKKEVRQPYEAFFRVDNRSAFKIALAHLETVKGKCIIRVNSRNDAKDLKKSLVKSKRYSKNEILLLNSDKRIKQSENFQMLSNEGKFKECIKLVVTTSVIDEGLSIRQKGFTDVVFIETQYRPTPEDVKQFFARFRNEDNERKNYFYFKEAKEQIHNSWNIERNYKEQLCNLIEYAKENEVLESNNKDIANNKYLYYNNKQVNKYMLAHDVSTSFFKTITTDEYKNFLEVNYNLFLIDEVHEKKVIDVKDIKEDKKKLQAKICNLWLNHYDEVADAIYTLTDKKEVKSIINFLGCSVEDSIYNTVFENLKEFEDLQIYTTKLESLNETEPNSVLIHNNSIVSRQKINTKINLLRNLETINNPKTKTDEKNKTKILNFINDVAKLEQFNSKDLMRLWKKQRSTSNKVSSTILKELVFYYHDYSMNNKLKKWVKKGC